MTYGNQDWKCIKFTAAGLDQLDYVRRCADALNAFPDETVDHFCAAAIRYRNNFLEDIGERQPTFSRSRDVLALIDPRALMVPMPKVGAPPVVHLECECDWEPEHGLECVIRNNAVLYLGGFNGEDPYSDFSEKQFWNYA